MSVRLSELKQKEVVNLCDGTRLGCSCDVVIDECHGRIDCIIVPGQSGFGGFFKGGKEIVIPWCKICKFGSDVILVDLDGAQVRKSS